MYFDWTEVDAPQIHIPSSGYSRFYLMSNQPALCDRGAIILIITILILIKYSLSPAGCMWMANYKSQCRKLQSLPSLWEFTELWAEPEPLTFCSEYKMLIHAAGNPELGERAVVLSSSLPQPLRLQLPVSLPPPEVTACPPIMLVCVLSGCLTHLIFLLAATDLNHTPFPWPLPWTMNQNPLRPHSLHSRKSA